jgi:MoxR-like ATPase
MDALSLASMRKKQLAAIARERGWRGDEARHSKEHFLRYLMGEALPAPVSKPIVMNVATAYTSPVQHMGYEVKEVGQETLGKLFGITGKYRGIKVPVYNDPDAPAVDPKWKWDAEKLAFFALNLPFGVWLFGPAGCGKTEFAKNFAAVTRRSFIRVSLDSGIERYELLGGERMRSGSTVYQDGLVLHGMRKVGALILLDEVTIGRAEHLAALHGILDSGVAVIQETHERVLKAPGVEFCVADNSNGRGDVSGMYAGIREMNFAFCDRYGAFIKFDFLSEAMETAVLIDRTGCTEPLAKLIVNLLKACRADSEAGNLEAPPTLRQAMSLARNLMWGLPPRTAWEIVTVNRASADAQEKLQQLWKANMADDLIARAVKGEKAPDAPAATKAPDVPF